MSMVFSDREIIDVDLMPILRELVELVGGEAADHLIAGHGDDGNELRLAQQLSQLERIPFQWNISGVGEVVGAFLWREAVEDDSGEVDARDRR